LKRKKMQTIPESGKHDQLNEADQRFVDRLFSTGFAFMMREDSEQLRDDFDDAIEDMKEDGTLDKLIKEYITDVVAGKEPKAVEFEDKGDETIKVAVTGDLPPMDYVAADGSFAGFNTAILSEIGKRLNKKIELKQVDSAARAMTLSSKEADVVFWTRVGTGKPDEEAMEQMEKRHKQHLSGEDEEKRKEIGEALSEGGSRMQREQMDMPEGTMVTDPYYVDGLVTVSLKE
jgi:DNA gyrase/topoisomerase IV subunit A